MSKNKFLLFGLNKGAKAIKMLRRYDQKSYLLDKA